MNEPLPKFDKPPVIETVLSAQFARLPTFSTAHAGCFWKLHLDNNWVTPVDAIRIDDQFERFGDERIWAPASALRFASAPESQRTQITRADNARIVQLQDSRFI